LLATVVVAARRVRSSREDGWRLAMLGITALLPVASWFTRNYVLSGDLTGSRQKYVALGWSLKSPSAMWDHPFFGRSAPVAFGDFAHGVLTTLWRGEITWHGEPMALPAVDWFYAISSVVFLAFAVVRACGARDGAERRAIWTSVVTVILAIVSLAVLSIVFDFG